MTSIPAWWLSCARTDRKSTRLNSSHMSISYAVFCLKKKKDSQDQDGQPGRREPLGRREGVELRRGAWSPRHQHARVDPDRFVLISGEPPRSPLFPYTTLFR